MRAKSTPHAPRHEFRVSIRRAFLRSCNAYTSTFGTLLTPYARLLSASAQSAHRLLHSQRQPRRCFERQFDHNACDVFVSLDKEGRERPGFRSSHTKRSQLLHKFEVIGTNTAAAPAPGGMHSVQLRGCDARVRDAMIHLDYADASVRLQKRSGCKQAQKMSRTLNLPEKSMGVNPWFLPAPPVPDRTSAAAH